MSTTTGLVQTMMQLKKRLLHHYSKILADCEPG